VNLNKYILYIKGMQVRLLTAFRSAYSKTVIRIRICG
jgi:hypothetical protein